MSFPTKLNIVGNEAELKVDDSSLIMLLMSDVEIVIASLASLCKAGMWSKSPVAFVAKGADAEIRDMILPANSTSDLEAASVQKKSQACLRTSSHSDCLVRRS